MVAASRVAAEATGNRTSVLEIKDVHAKAGDTQILNGINLTVR